MKKNQPKALAFNNVAKTYTLRHQKPTLVGALLKLESQEQFHALKNVSFEIDQGEKVGIIGPNGSGKTTILKICAGLTTPTSGQVSVNGKVVSLIELSAGFHPELTGEENIFLNGLIVGMTRQEIEAHYQKIVRFSGLKKFIDAPLYTYSSGMVLRLGFAVAVHSDPDILILDETIAVGDEAFRAKSLKKINEFFKQGKTVITVSHWLDYLKKYCTRILWLADGKIVRDGGTEIIKAYQRSAKK
jgi:ABC-type polysaccharide/polyol phosphate transport system ATPase subunit